MRPWYRSDPASETVALTFPSVVSSSAWPVQDMKRGYTIERYREIIDKVRRYIPDASFSSDIIVGFPGTASWRKGRQRPAQ